MWLPLCKLQLKRQPNELKGTNIFSMTVVHPNPSFASLNLWNFPFPFSPPQDFSSLNTPQRIPMSHQEINERIIKKVCVFCGSKDPASSEYAEKTDQLGKELVKRGFGLVYGGGTVGLMGVLARRVDQEGGEVLGFIPGALAPKEISGNLIGKAIVTKDMHERKLNMYQHSDAFIALPGGFGTFEELMEIITWQQLGIHSKPIGLLNVDNYYTPLLQLIQNGVKQGFISPSFAEGILVVESEPDKLLDRLVVHQTPQPRMKWLDATQV